MSPAVYNQEAQMLARVPPTVSFSEFGGWKTKSVLIYGYISFSRRHCLYSALRPAAEVWAVIEWVLFFMKFMNFEGRNLEKKGLITSGMKVHASFNARHWCGLTC